MHRVMCIAVAVLFCFFSALKVEADHIAQGDFDGDGDVDFTDYLIFAKNFGKDYATLSRIAHTVDTLHVVRVDTLTVQHILRDTVTVRETVTVEIPLSLPYPNITIKHGGDWGMSLSQLQGVLEDVRDSFASLLVYPIDSNISVEYDPSGPLVRGHRARDGSYIVLLSSWGYEQTIYQFAHEYGHILSGYVVNPSHIKQLWLEESLAVLASLFALKTLATNPQYPNLSYYYQLTIWGTTVPQNLAQWHLQNKSQLEANARLWDKNTVVALALLDIFERYPEDAWNAVKYKDRGTVYYDSDFNIYMNEWYRRTPPQWQHVVLEIMNRFGVERSGKPAIASTEKSTDLIGPAGKEGKL